MAPEIKKSKKISSQHETGNGAATAKQSVTTIDSLPSEVLKIIVELPGEDVSALKTWRLVSKSWNEACCRILQKVSAVPLNVAKEDGGEALEKFNQLILDRHAYFPSDWPNPFQNLKILQASLVTPALARFVQSPKYKITTLEILHVKGFVPNAVKKILEQHMENLIHLNIRGNSDSASFLKLTGKLGRGDWSSLKSLTLTDTCKASSKPCPHVQFIIALTQKAKLEEITLDGDLTNITRVFTNSYYCWDKLVSLDLQSLRPPPNLGPEEINEFMKWGTEIKFQALTTLRMWFRDDGKPDQTSEQYTPYLLPLIQKSALVVQFLHVGFIPLSLLPRLPKVEYLSFTVMNGDRIQDVTRLKFPSLTSVSCRIFWTEVPAYAAVNPMDSNHNVAYLGTFWRVADMPAALTKELLWWILGNQFPNLNTLSTYQKVTSSTLHVIKKRFPGLQNLHLEFTTSSDLLGTPYSSDLTSKGWPCEAFENSALLEMTELTDLTLGDLVLLNREAITACLGKLYRMKLLRFHWNKSLWTSDVLEHLRHIPDLTIVYKDNQQKRELEKLTKAMKCLKLVKDC